jgi:hypothetical protein
MIKLRISRYGIKYIYSDGVCLRIYTTGNKYWYLDGKRHRVNGPAVVWYRDGTGDWHWHGRLVTEFEHMMLRGQ